jgi:hypothetical protein
LITPIPEYRKRLSRWLIFYFVAPKPDCAKLLDIKYPKHNFPMPNGVLAFKRVEPKEDLNYGVKISTVIEMIENGDLL